MDLHTKIPSGAQIVEAIEQADPAQIRQHYYEIIKVMQTRMTTNQEPFK